jgi:hypothetical protein
VSPALFLRALRGEPVERPRDRSVPEAGRSLPEYRALHKGRTRPMLTSFDIHATGMPILDAQADFRRARRAYLIVRLVRWLSWHPHSPRTLRSVSEHDFLPGGPRRMEVVPIASIVGTVDPTTEFDGRFRPASKRLRRRWERIALAHRKGIALPPIDLRRGPDGYYVVDGRHRVSVARGLGYRDIDAWVTG